MIFSPPDRAFYCVYKYSHIRKGGESFLSNKRKGYPVPFGYMGLMPDGQYHLFDTEDDYNTIIKGEYENEEEDKN